MTPDPTPQEHDLIVRVTATADEAQVLADAVTELVLPIGGSVLVQPKQDSDELPDMTTLLVQSEALDAVRESASTLATNDPYTEQYERALAKLLPSLHAMLGIQTQADAEVMSPAPPVTAPAAPAEPIKTDW